MNEQVFAFGVPVIMALVELAKQLGFPSRYAGVLAVAVGMVGFIAAERFGGVQLAQAGFGGLLAGLTAAGLYSTAKNTAGK